MVSRQATAIRGAHALRAGGVHSLSLWDPAEHPGGEPELDAFTETCQCRPRMMPSGSLGSAGTGASRQSRPPITRPNRALRKMSAHVAAPRPRRSQPTSRPRTCGPHADTTEPRTRQGSGGTRPPARPAQTGHPNATWSCTGVPTPTPFRTTASACRQAAAAVPRRSRHTWPITPTPTERPISAASVGTCFKASSARR